MLNQTFYVKHRIVRQKKSDIVLLFIYLFNFPTLVKAEVPAGGLVEKLLEVGRGFADFREEVPLAMDRERVGDWAVQDGIRYFAIRVPIAQLPDVLISRYLPEMSEPDRPTIQPQFFEAIGSNDVLSPTRSRFRKPQVYLDSTLPIWHAGLPLGPVLPQSAILLFSPRILSLFNWSYGDRADLAELQSYGQSMPEVYCKGTCVTNSNSEETVREVFRTVSFEREPRSREAFLFYEPIPLYELIGIVVQQSNEGLIRSLVEKTPRLDDWKSRFHFSDTFPDLDPKSVLYLEFQKRPLLEDLLSSVEGRGKPGVEPEPGVWFHYNPVFKMTPDFVESVRGLVGTMDLNSHDVLRDVGETESSNYASSGLSQLMLDLADDDRPQKQNLGLDRILSGSRLVRRGLFSVDAVKVWNFALAEYRDSKNKSIIVIFFDPDRTQGFSVWGIGRSDGSRVVEWLSIPEPSDPSNYGRIVEVLSKRGVDPDAWETTPKFIERMAFFLDETEQDDFAEWFFSDRYRSRRTIIHRMEMVHRSLDLIKKGKLSDPQLRTAAETLIFKAFSPGSVLLGETYLPIMLLIRDIAGKTHFFSERTRSRVAEYVSETPSVPVDQFKKACQLALELAKKAG